MTPKRGPRYACNKRRRERAFERAKWLYEMLLRSLGYACAQCGEAEPSLLQVDHVDGITWRHRALRYDARVARYVREWAEGEARMRCLCVHCNASRNQSVHGYARQPGDDDLSPGWVWDHDEVKQEAPDFSGGVPF
jgi:hypothetical protein